MVLDKFERFCFSIEKSQALIIFIIFFFVPVGSPMDLPKIEEPTREQINEYHGKFVEHLVDFFEKEKHKYVENADTVHLEFV